LPKVIDSAVKSRIINLYLEGKLGRNAIAETPGIKAFCSSGTVSNVLKQYQEQSVSKATRSFGNEPEKKSDSHLTERTFHKEISAEVKKNSGLIEDNLITESPEKIKNAGTSEPETPQTQPDIKLERAQSAPTTILQTEEKIRQEKKEQIEKDIIALQAEKTRLILKIAEGQKVLNVNLMKHQDIIKQFSAVKREMIKTGIKPSELSKFLPILTTFKDYNYDSGRILLDLAHIQEEKSNLQQQKQELDKQQEIIDSRLEEIGFGNFNQLEQTVIALTTLRDNYGIGMEQIISIVQSASRQQLERRGREWGYCGVRKRQ
jgi:hypothetical protein